MEGALHLSEEVILALASGYAAEHIQQCAICREAHERHRKGCERATESTLRKVMARLDEKK